MDSKKHAETHAIVQALRQLVNGLRVTAHSVERELGLTGAQLFVLGEIAAEPNLSIRRVSERTLTDPSSASVVVARLLEKGLVARREDPADRRKSVLSVTSKGQKLLARAPEPPRHGSLAERLDGATIVFVVCDRGDRYLSTGVFPA